MKKILLCLLVLLSVIEFSHAQCDFFTTVNSMMDKVSAFLLCYTCEPLWEDINKLVIKADYPAIRKSAEFPADTCDKLVETGISDVEKMYASYEKDLRTYEPKCAPLLAACPDTMQPLIDAFLAVPDKLAECLGECVINVDASNAFTALDKAIQVMTQYVCREPPYTKEYLKFLDDESKRQVKTFDAIMKAFAKSLQTDFADKKKALATCLKSTVETPLKNLKAGKCP